MVSSEGSGSVRPGAQRVVSPRALKPALEASATRTSAVAGSGCLTASSSAPTQIGCPSSVERRNRAHAPTATAAASAAASSGLVTATTLDCVAGQVPSVEEKLKGLPAKPGVYLFRDARGQVLYIGKAKSLRPRVRSYFQKGETRATIAQLPERVADLEVIVTDTEVEALHLEQNLVKRHRPPFNVRLRDDKSFPYIAVTVEDEYPRVMFTRERHRRGVVYFGPYANAKKVRETLDVLNRVFPYRPCEGPQPGRHSGIPCLDYHIERCLAPCVGYVSKEDYRKVIDGVIEFLSGETRPIVGELEEKMKGAADQERFEEAARYRNRLFAVSHLAERQAADKRAVGTIDVIGIAAEDDRAAVQVFPLRDGKLIDRYSFHLENVEGKDTATLLEAFVLEYYGSAPSVPPQIVVPREVGETAALAEFLTERRGSRVEVRAPERGEKRRLQELAAQNARLALESEAVAVEQTRLRRVEALEELREALNLESLPLRIECYDISNIQEESPVGSMVVFQDAVPKKAHYRKFGIKRAEGQDDYAALAQVVSRRFARMRDVADEEYDESFAATPNLVVVDGGKGQLSAVLAAMQAYDLPRVAVISLAKRAEEVFVPDRTEPIVLDRHSPGLQLLQRIRDEAHRFALGFHRQRRDAKAKESIFDTLPGVGPARRRALLQHFGSAERFLAASQEELEGVPGIPAKTARSIYAQLHKAGRA
ncbi:MAG: excinuclease ABC subunit UvrC [Actinobacteria bacterium]|nr:MAG: excinuclease ABC subunit UvrC [Actinomycetota bacterium]